FADPPLNTARMVKAGDRFLRADRPAIVVPDQLANIQDGPVTIAFQPHHLGIRPTEHASVPIRARTLVSEIAGSESFIHLDYEGERWVMLTHGIFDVEPDREIEVFLDTRHLMAFDEAGRAVGTSATAIQA